jgi:hypothetical protein
LGENRNPLISAMRIRLTEHSTCLAVFWLCVALNLGLSLVGFRNSPLEIHQFRQLQTALSSRETAENGLALAYPMPLFGPPWSAPMEFPIYEACVAKVSVMTGWAIEPAGRFVSMVFLYLALPACLGLAANLGIPPARRWLFAALILVSPVYAYYSRAIMIESTALCACAWFLLAYLRAIDSGSRKWLAAAMAFGVIAALAKVTTLIVFLAAGAVYTLSGLRTVWPAPKPARNRMVMWIVSRGLLATLPAIVAGSLWVHYADLIKRSNPLSAFLASGPMTPFNFGTLHQRLSGEFWQRIAYHTANSVISPFSITLVLLFALFTPAGWSRRALLLLAGFAAGPLIFSNLYFVHDYYFYGNGAFLLAALALAWSRLLDNGSLPLAAKVSVIGLSLGLQLALYLQNYFTIQQRPMDESPELAHVLALSTEPDDVLLIYGQDWDSTTAYFANRRAVMVTDARFTDPASVEEVLHRLKDDDITALVVTGHLRGHEDFARKMALRLKLHPLPILTSRDTLVYLAPRRLARAVAQVQLLPLKTLDLSAPPENPPPALPRLRFFPAAIKDRNVATMMTPAPALILHPFGLAAHELDGKKVLNAHAPTDVIFAIPHGARNADASFGILPSAYTNGNKTDGVEFRIELVTTSGEHQLLGGVYLSPSERPDDRGEKTIHVSLPSTAEGQVWFRTLPGPANNVGCDWAYWSQIELR